MRSYWVKIVLGACAIFAVGYVAVFAVRKTSHRIRSFAESSDPVSIPLAFLPFTLDGEKQGTFKMVRLDRDAPKSLTGITVRIALADSADAARIRGCVVTLEGNGRDFDPSRGFRCLRPEEADSSLVQFGEVTFTLRGMEEFSIPLMLDSAAVNDMRESGTAEIEATVEAEAEARGREAEHRADSITRAVNRQVDSIVRHAVPAAPKTPRTAAKPG
jgi:hypothetical protein